MATMKKTGTMKKWTVMLIVADNDDDDDDDDSLGRVELVVVGGKHMKGDTPPTPPLRAHYPAVHTSIVLRCLLCSAFVVHILTYCPIVPFALSLL